MDSEKLEVQRPLIPLDVARAYLRIDNENEDEIIIRLLALAEQLCIDVARCDSAEEFARTPYAQTAILYALAYLYEHREEADHHDLVMTLRFLLSALREGVL